MSSSLACAGVHVPLLIVKDTTTSTNDDARKLVDDGSEGWTTVVADSQSAGRGRLGREWVAPPGSALQFSTLLRPPADWAATAWGWIPLIAGLAVCSAVRKVGVPAELKWPNDVVVSGDAFDGSPGPRKLAGILAERHGGGAGIHDVSGVAAAIVGIGINVSSEQTQLPIPAATSLAIERGRIESSGGVGATESRPATVSRAEVLADCLSMWQARWTRFVEADGEPISSGLLAEYASMSATIGQRVRVVIGNDQLIGDALDIDSSGHLIVDTHVGIRNVSAGDVVHLRLA